MNFRVTRKFTFEAGHRIAGHESKCRHFHGHSYKLHITVKGVLDDLGRVIDFGALKALVEPWVNERLDHVTLLDRADEEGRRAMREVRGQPVYLLPYPPTAENIARHLAEDVLPDLLPAEVELLRVTVQETEKCQATVQR